MNPGDASPMGALFAGAAHLILAFWLIAMAAKAAVSALSRPGHDRPAWKRAAPSRQTTDSLRRICLGSRNRGFYRSIVAGRLRTLVRDRLSLELGLSDADAFKALRDGRTRWQPSLLSCALDDHLLAKKRGRAKSGAETAESDFLERVERLLDALEGAMPSREEGRPYERDR